MTRVKMCGLQTAHDVDAAIEAGADAVGVVVASPRSRRDVPLDHAARLVARVPPFATAVAVTAATESATIARILERVRPQALQLPASATDAPAAARRLGVRVLCAASAPEAEALALDPRAPDATEPVVLDALDGSYGGTGRRVDTGAAARLVALLAPRPVVVAGGLTVDNVADTVMAVRPYAVDVSSGIETDGVKDPRRMRVFVRAVKEADARAA